MIKKLIKIIIVFLSICLLLVLLFFRGSIPRYYFTDKPPCVNVDSFFDASNYTGSDYKIKTREILKKSRPSDFRYFFKSFTGSNREYLLVNLRNEKYCFEVEMLVLDWDILWGMRRTNGVSYPNELYNLEWEIDTINGKEEILYRNMHGIVD